MGAIYRTTLAPPPFITFSTSLRVTIEVSPGVVDASAPLNTAVQTVLLAYDEMFVQGPSLECRFEVQQGNESLLRFHPKLGAQIEREDEHEVFFVTTRADYLAARPRYRRWLPTEEMGGGST